MFSASALPYADESTLVVPPPLWPHPMRLSTRHENGAREPIETGDA